ncbi:MAG: phosphoribosylglycinamide formyltransferase [Candidatus Ozemobacteraceae bacterium]
MTSSPARLAIMLSGRGTNMTAIAENCRNGVLKGLAEVAVVVGNSPEARGLLASSKFGFPTVCVPSQGRSREDFEYDLINVLNAHKPDFVVLAGFMRILSPVFIEAFRNRIINIHPADPEVYRGPSGYKYAFENKLPSTFITVHYVDENVDTGNIICRREVSLLGADTLAEVEKRGLAVEHILYSETLASLLESRKS